MERIKVIREARGWTQDDLAAASGLNQGYLSKMENGTANASLDKIRAVASALGVEPYDLFAPSDLKGRALLALSMMDGGSAEAAVVVLEAMVPKTPQS